MEFSTVLQIITTIIMFLMGVIYKLSLDRVKSVEQEQEAQAERIWHEITTLRKESNGIRYNYLDRFDDLKDTLKQFELKLIERITILETRLTK